MKNIKKNHKRLQRLDAILIKGGESEEKRKEIIKKKMISFFGGPMGYFHWLSCTTKYSNEEKEILFHLTDIDTIKGIEKLLSTYYNLRKISPPYESLTNSIKKVLKM